MENPDRLSEIYAHMEVLTEGNLRFVERNISTDAGHPQVVRILQRYEWSYTLSDFGWFDVPLVEEEPPKNN